MKGAYRVWIIRSGEIDWELVGSAKWADEAHVMAAGWESNSEVDRVRVDVCVRFWEAR